MTVSSPQGRWQDQDKEYAIMGNYNHQRSSVDARNWGKPRLPEAMEFLNQNRLVSKPVCVLGSDI